MVGLQSLTYHIRKEIRPKKDAHTTFHFYVAHPPTIQILPDVLCLKRIASDQAGNHMLFKIARHGKLTSVQYGIAQAIDTGPKPLTNATC